jgi:hypothetical protein
MDKREQAQTLVKAAIEALGAGKGVSKKFVGTTGFKKIVDEALEVYCRDVYNNEHGQAESISEILSNFFGIGGGGPSSEKAMKKVADKLGMKTKKGSFTYSGGQTEVVLLEQESGEPVEFILEELEKEVGLEVVKAFKKRLLGK